MSFQRVEYQKKNWVRHNEQIRLPQVLVIQDGLNLGVMATRDAIALARTHDLDLVEVAPQARPPVCHIMEYGKYMYDKQKKEKTKVSTMKEKEITFRYVIDDHDLDTKANQCKRFLEKGMKVKLTVKFKAREKAHKDQGFVILNRMLDMLKDCCSIEKAPLLEGNNVSARVGSKEQV